MAIRVTSASDANYSRPVNDCSTVSGGVHPAFRRRRTSHRPSGNMGIDALAIGIIGSVLVSGYLHRRNGADADRRNLQPAAAGAIEGRCRPRWTAPWRHRRRSVAATWTNTPVSSAISRPRPRGNGPPFILPRMKPSSGSASITSSGAFA
jgi:hypothetical protein